MPSSGQIQLYTGNGKGKTTAALGLALRLAGSGGRTCFLQFMKGQPYSELNAVQRLGDQLVIEQYGSPRLCLPNDADLDQHRQLAARGMDRARQVSQDQAYDLVVLDEIVTALYFTLVAPAAVTDLLDRRYAEQELVLTGRYAPRWLIDRSDLVTEMAEIRHYYTQDVAARPGIEC